jgi:hypothetical protein
LIGSLMESVANQARTTKRMVDCSCDLKKKIEDRIVSNEKRISEIPRYDLGRGLDDELEIEIRLLKELLVKI